MAKRQTIPIPFGTRVALRRRGRDCLQFAKRISNEQRNHYGDLVAVQTIPHRAPGSSLGFLSGLPDDDGYIAFFKTLGRSDH